MISESTMAESDAFSVEIDDMSCEGLGIADCSIETAEKANQSIDIINSAIDKVSVQRGEIGAVEKRMEHKFNVLSTTNENLTAFESQIRDADIANEMMEFTKYEILSGSAQAMVAQANTEPMKVVDLLTNSAVKTPERTTKAPEPKQVPAKPVNTENTVSE
jgi:flagellin